jgi:hypothetical protein
MKCPEAAFPGIDLVGINLIASSQFPHRRPLAQRLHSDLRLRDRINLSSQLLRLPLQRRPRSKQT